MQITFKKLLLTPPILLITAGFLLIHNRNALAQQGNGQGQGQTMWKTTGNQASSTEFIGTTNQQDVIIKSNNLERIRFEHGGDIKIPGFGNGNGGMIYHGPDGKLGSMQFNGMFNQVLTGNGAFSNISLISGWERSAGQVVSLTGDKIGIDVANPTEKLEVNGNAKFYGNLITNGSLFFGGNNVISYQPATGNLPEIYSFGKSINHDLINQCLVPSVPVTQLTPLIQLGGNSAANLGGTPNVMTIGFDGANGRIEMAGTNNTGATKLLINYDCGKDVVIGSETSGNLIVKQKIGIGTWYPLTEKLHVEGNIKTNGLIMPWGAGQGKVLTSDDDGNATWQVLRQSQWNTNNAGIDYVGNVGKVQTLPIKD